MTQTLTLNGLANHIAGAKGGLPQEWQDWATEIETDLRKLANREAQPVAIVESSAYVTAAQIIGDEPPMKAVKELYEGALVIGQHLYTAPPAPAVPDDVQHLKNVQELYHRQEDRLFALAQRIKGASFEKYSHSTDQAIGVLEREIFGDDGDACRAAMLAQPVSQGYKLNSPEIPDSCEWTYDEHDYKWDSACGEAWMFSDGGPTENGVKFCQGCGKPVLLAAAPEGGK